MVMLASKITAGRAPEAADPVAGTFYVESLIATGCTTPDTYNRRIQ